MPCSLISCPRFMLQKLVCTAKKERAPLSPPSYLGLCGFNQEMQTIDVSAHLPHTHWVLNCTSCVLEDMDWKTETPFPITAPTHRLKGVLRHGSLRILKPSRVHCSQFQFWFNDIGTVPKGERQVLRMESFAALLRDWLYWEHHERIPCLNNGGLVK